MLLMMMMMMIYNRRFLCRTLY